MDKINIHRSTFLEKEELNRMVGFLNNDARIKGVLSASLAFGLVSPGAKPGAPFRVTTSTTFGTINIVGGYVIDSSLRAYFVDNQVNFPVPNDGKYYWLKVSPFTRNFENGYVQVDTSGNVSGTVNFAGIIRGQSSQVSTALRFIKDDGTEPLNNSVYQVVDIINTNNIVLSSGYPFKAENQLRVLILGSIPMGRRFTDEQLEGLYTFETYKLSLVVEPAIGVEPPKGQNEYYISRVRNSGGVITVLEERVQFWTLGVGGSDPGTLFTFTIIPIPSDAQVIIDGVITASAEGIDGRTFNYSVSKTGYLTKTGTFTLQGKDATITVELEEDPNPPVFITVTVKTDSGDVTQGGVSINNTTSIDKPEDSLSVELGTTVKIAAQPSAGFIFSAWSVGGSVVSSVAIQDIVPSATIEYVASFIPDSDDKYWDFEVKLENPIGDITHELFTVPTQDGSGYEGVMVLREGDPQPVSCTPTTKTVAQGGESFTLTITTDNIWNVTLPNDWVTSSKMTGVGDDVITLTVVPNTSEQRTSNVKISTATDSSFCLITQSSGVVTTQFTMVSNPVEGGTAGKAESDVNVVFTAVSSPQSYFARWVLTDTTDGKFIIPNAYQNPLTYDRTNNIFNYSKVTVTAWFLSTPEPVELVTENTNPLLGTIEVTEPEPPSQPYWFAEFIPRQNGVFSRYEKRYIAGNALMGVFYEGNTQVYPVDIKNVKVKAIFISESQVQQPITAVSPTGMGTLTVVSEGQKWRITPTATAGYTYSICKIVCNDGGGNRGNYQTPSFLLNKSEIQQFLTAVFAPTNGYPVTLSIVDSAVVTQAIGHGDISVEIIPKSGFGLVWTKQKSKGGAYNNNVVAGSPLSFDLRVGDEITSFEVETRSLTNESIVLLPILPGLVGHLTAVMTGTGEVGSQVTLTATVSSEYNFGGWYFYNNSGGYIKRVFDLQTTFTVVAGETVVTANAFKKI